MARFLYKDIVLLSNEESKFLDENSISVNPAFTERKFINTFDKEAYAYSIDTYLKFYKKNKVYFFDAPESFEPVSLDFANKVSSILQDHYRIPLENIRYVCSACPSQANLELYRQHCTNNNLYNLPLTLYNFFEYSMACTIRTLSMPVEKKQISIKPKIFTCLNGVGRLSRVYLFLYFLKYHLLDQAFFSFHANYELIGHSIRNTFFELERHRTTSNSIISTNPENFYTDLSNLYENFLNSNISLPIIQTIDPQDREAQHSISQDDLELFDNSYFSVITETSFFKRLHLWEHGHLKNHYNSHLDSTFLTEKTYRAIACRHPFIMVSRPHTLKYLREAGYKTFSPWIDESYDDIEDDFIRLQKIAEIIRDLCQKNSAFWLQFMNETQDIVSHNFNVLLNKQVCHVSG